MTTKPTLIGLTGRIGSGKSTVGAMIADLEDRDDGTNMRYDAPHTPPPLVEAAVRIAFANPLKAFCRKVFDFSEEQVYGDVAAKEAPDPRWVRIAAGSISDYACCHAPNPPEDVFLTPRFAMQQLGTEFGRACAPDVWVRYAIRYAEHLIRRGYPLVVVTDTRFRNEAAAIREAGGVVYRVVGRGIRDSDAAQHASERDIDVLEVNSEIDNSGTFDDLRRAVNDQLVRDGFYPRRDPL